MDQETLRSFPIHFSYTSLLVKMHLERSAECDKREIINNRSAIHAQSNAEGILNRFACKAPVFSLMHNFTLHLLGNLSPAAFAHHKISAYPAQKGRECFFRS